MTPVLKVFSILGAAVLVAASGAAGYAALQSCAVRSDFLSALNGCPTEAELALQAELVALEARRAGLRAEILRNERVLAARQCDAIPPSSTAPITRMALEGGDLEALYGCWSLGSSYRTRDVDTGKVISYPTWSMCFDTQGRGKQIMQGDDGSTCEGPVEARIDSPARLILGEGGNLACSDGGYIHRRDIACVAAGGGLSCATLQPETEGQAEVPFTRWQ
ncbi:hypothetical protein [Roseobacter weihaiensis]|uniref:hypothetical protein n=1 Tax=Roseobacter weihaiensis TaxID=2763262 RepID=UPI001D09B490|nr:hypothetical protein [Roseobacter sp. H9]